MCWWKVASWILKLGTFIYAISLFSFCGRGFPPCITTSSPSLHDIISHTDVANSWYCPNIYFLCCFFVSRQQWTVIYASILPVGLPEIQWMCCSLLRHQCGPSPCYGASLVPRNDAVKDCPDVINLLGLDQPCSPGHEWSVNSWSMRTTWITRCGSLCFVFRHKTLLGFGLGQEI